MKNESGSPDEGEKGTLDGQLEPIGGDVPYKLKNGTNPLSDAVQWLANHTGQSLRQAYDAVLKKIIAGEMKLWGRGSVSDLMERIPPDVLAALAIYVPCNDEELAPSLDYILGESPYLDAYENAIYVRRKVKWRDLSVDGADIARMRDENESAPPARPPRIVSRAPDPPPRLDPGGYVGRVPPPLSSEANRLIASAFTPEQGEALRNIYAGIGTPVAAAKTLKSAAEIVEMLAPRLPRIPATKHADAAMQLLWLSETTLARVERGDIPSDQAVAIGYHMRKSFARHHEADVCEDFQANAIDRLAEVQPLCAGCAWYEVERVADRVLEEQKEERRRLECERIWKEPDWSVWNVLSWIAFREPRLLLEIEDDSGLNGLARYTETSWKKAKPKEAKPQQLLLTALKRGELMAIRRGSGEEVPTRYWFGRTKVDRNTWFEADSVRRLWPGETVGVTDTGSVPADDDLRGDLEHAYKQSCGDDGCAYVELNDTGGACGWGDPVMSLGQTLIWLALYDPEAVGDASNDGGRLGIEVGQVRAAAVLDRLNPEPEWLQRAANDLRRACLEGRLTAYDGNDCAIPVMRWRHMTVVLDDRSMPWIMRNGHGALADVVFHRDDILRLWPPQASPSYIEALEKQLATATGHRAVWLAAQILTAKRETYSPAFDPTGQGAAVLRGGDDGAVQPGASTDQLAIGTAKAEAIASETQQGKRRTPKLKFDWPDAMAYARKLIEQEGEFRPWDRDSKWDDQTRWGWQTQADLERMVSDYIMKKEGEAPAESTVRKHVTELLAIVEKEKNEGR